MEEVIATCSKALELAGEGKIDDALQILDELYESLEDELEKSFVLEKKAGILSMSGKVEESLSLYEDVISTQLKAVDEDIPMAVEMLSTSFYNLGSILTDIGAFKEAELAYERSLDFLERIGGEENYAADVGGTLYHLGFLAQERGDNELARNRYEKALRIFETIKSDAEVHTVMCANILNNLGVIEARSGELERAEEFFRQASGRYVEVDSLESLFYAATTLGSLGMIRRELGKMDDARDAYSDALEIAQKLLDKSGDDELYKAVAMRLINELEEMKNAL